MLPNEQLFFVLSQFGQNLLLDEGRPILPGEAYSKMGRTKVRYIGFRFNFFRTVV